MAIALDPARTSSDLTLSNGNKTVTRGAGNDHRSAFSQFSTADLDIYFEGVVGSGSTGGEIGVGVATSAASVSNYVGASAGCSYQSNGNVIKNGVLVTTHATFQTGDVIGVAYKGSTDEIWFRKNGTWQVGDPGAGTSPSATGVTGTMFPGISCFSSGNVNTIRQRDSEYSGSIPSGFLAPEKTAAIAVSQAADTGDLEAALQRAAELDATQANNTADINVLIPFSAVIAATQSPDTANLDAQLPYTIEIDATQANNAANIDAITLYGHIAATQAADSADLIAAWSNSSIAAVQANNTADINTVWQNLIFSAFADSDAGNFIAFRAYENLVVEPIVISDNTTSRVDPTIIERLAGVDATATMLEAINNLASSIAFNDVVILTRDLLISEGITFSSAVAEDLNRIEDIVESLVASGATVTRLEAITLLASAMAISESATAAFAMTVVEALDADDSLISTWIAYATAISSALLTDTTQTGQSVFMEVTDESGASDSIATQMTMSELLADNATITATVIVDGIEYTAWTVNTETGAPSEYSNYSFNSMFRLGQSYYGLSEEGLFKLEGDDDNGAKIAMSILTGEVDFDSPAIKRMDQVHMGITTTGDVILKIITTHEGKKIENWYRAVNGLHGTSTETRFTPGKGLTSRWWQFEILNTQGREAELSRIDYRLLNLSRRI